MSPAARPEKRTVNLTLRTIVASLGMLLLLSCGSGIAAAHTALANSDPAEDATVTTPPAAIVLTFNEDINPAFASVAVSSADGRNWISGSPRVEGARLTSAVGPDRPGNGVYTVGYRVVSADGHRVTGSYKFTITGVSEEPSPNSTPVTPSTAAAPPPSAAPASSDTKTTVLSAAVAGLALGGVIAFWQSRRHRRKTPPMTKPRYPRTRPTHPQRSNDRPVRCHPYSGDEACPIKSPGTITGEPDRFWLHSVVALAQRGTVQPARAKMALRSGPRGLRGSLRL